MYGAKKIQNWWEKGGKLLVDSTKSIPKKDSQMK